MEATALLPATPRLPLRRFSAKHPSYNITRRKGLILAQQGDHQNVDENMIVLKMRIKKLKVSESSRSNQEGRRQQRRRRRLPTGMSGRRNCSRGTMRACVTPSNFCSRS
ncbi:UNVERIFIED_CONTAM: hypothetical protein Slati_1561700 [Sesamum latifolium]|uniref:Uncharacterized protein n=1 Tax=Sesamum latifolium TaxID=2727402 RepID=A0AAW2X895_9LAMI